MEIEEEEKKHRDYSIVKREQEDMKIIRGLFPKRWSDHLIKHENKERGKEILNEIREERNKIINGIWKQRSAEVNEWEKMMGISNKKKKEKKTKKSRKDGKKSAGENREVQDQKRAKEEWKNIIRDKWLERHIINRVDKGGIYMLE